MRALDGGREGEGVMGGESGGGGGGGAGGGQVGETSLEGGRERAGGREGLGWKGRNHDTSRF